MTAFRDLPIRRKLTVVILLSASAAVLLAGTVGIVFEFLRYRGAIVRDMTVQAEIIGEASAAALAFQDERAARETLATLHARPEVVSARLYRPDGKLFAEYVRPGETIPVHAPSPPFGHRFEHGQLVVDRTVALAGDTVGTICLRTDLREQQLRLRSYALIAFNVIGISLCLAVILAQRLQRFISDPLLALARLTREVAARSDFSLRADKKGDDEIGVLTDDFNRMLGQIQRGEESLRSSEERFRQVTENIHEVFWMTNLDKTEMIYVSRAYEEIWGWPVGTLYAEPRSWMESIHHEDRERVRAASGQQASGRYDEQYRIVRPDGSLRWIHDRAFPVRDSDGKVYRIAGIAEDITERKRAEQALQTQAQILESMLEGVLMYDEQERILITNPSLDAMFGYKRGELIGQSTFILNPCPPERSVKIAEEIRQQLQTQKTVERQFVNRRKDGSEFISESRICLLEIHGQRCRVAVVQDVTERKRLERGILEISEREQARIGQDLHDGLCQHLYSTALAAKILHLNLSEQHPPLAEQAGTIGELLNEAIAQARQVARGLYPVKLEAEGLKSALNELAAHTRDRFQIDCSMECADGVPATRAATAIHLFRIAQEAVTNAVKHAKAGEIRIQLTADAQRITVQVADDGQGLPAAPPDGMGLHIMEYRARIIGGELSIRPGPHGGTVVTGSLPLFGGKS